MLITVKRCVIALAMAGVFLTAPSVNANSAVVFVGDGMGFTTIAAARIFKAQKSDKDSLSGSLSFEAFPKIALIKTASADAQIPDSAATMSSIMTGEKTNSGMIGVGSTFLRGNCNAVTEDSLKTLVELAESSGKLTGIISTSRITDATPAAAYAHVPDRRWENNASTPQRARAENCGDIAKQLIRFNHGNGIDLVLGGGRENFLPAELSDEEYPELNGKRQGADNLVQQWLAQGKDRRYVWNRSQLSSIDTASVQQILGLFEPKEMLFEAERALGRGDEPSLTEMVEFAIEFLQEKSGDNGFLLIVEAARIDHGNHFKNTYLALSDTIELSNAVEKALPLLALDETLMLVTADHASSLAFTGYPEKDMPVQASLSFPSFTFLGGSGFQRGHMQNEATLDSLEFDPNAVPSPHAGEDVPAYAIGKGSSAVSGVLEQKELFKVISDVIFDEASQ